MGYTQQTCIIDLDVFTIDKHSLASQNANPVSRSDKRVWPAGLRQATVLPKLKLPSLLNNSLLNVGLNYCGCT